MSVLNTVLQPHAADPAWNVQLSLYEVNPDGPLCIQVPGIRSQGIHSPDNAVMSDMMVERDISVMAYDYGGCANWLRCWDPATLDTHIRDTKLAIAFAGARDHVLLSKSAGITMALAAANEHTRAIVASIPAPDLFQNLSEPYFARKPFFHKWGFDALLHLRGFYCWTSKSEPDRPIPFIKITKEFVASTKTNRIGQVIEHNPHRPPVHCIVNDGDRLFHPRMINALCKELRAAGYEAGMEIVQGEKHAYSPATRAAILTSVQRFSCQ